MREALPGLPTFQPVPMDRWGRDHRTTLMYVEARCVDHRGRVKLANLRVDPDRHPMLMDRRLQAHGSGKGYPTRLAGGEELFGHDDWDCIEDAEALGLLRWTMDGDGPLLEMTPAGLEVTARWRAEKASRR